MKTNVGNLDRIVRIVLGIGILAAGYLNHSSWGLVGLLPLLTGLVRVCPAYMPFGLSTCPVKPVDPKA